MNAVMGGMEWEVEGGEEGEGDEDWTIPSLNDQGHGHHSDGYGGGDSVFEGELEVVVVDE